MLTLGRSKFKIRILYRSGQSHTLWVHSFCSEKGTIKWETASHKDRILKLNFEEIEAIFQVDRMVGLNLGRFFKFWQ